MEVHFSTLACPAHPDVLEGAADLDPGEVFAGVDPGLAGAVLALLVR